MKRIIRMMALALMSILITGTFAIAGQKGRRGRGLPPEGGLTREFNEMARGKRPPSGVRTERANPTQPRPRGPYFRPH